MATLKRKDQQRKACANYRAKMKAYIVELLATIEKLKTELQRYRG